MTPASTRAAPAAIVISSHVARGSVGNRAMVFGLEALGICVWAVPTIVLPWHLGHGPGTAIIPPSDGFADLMADLRAAPWLDEVSAVISGYLGDSAQAAPIGELVGAVKARNAGALYLCDPVSGDENGLYVPEERVETIRERLLARADIATPNLHELEWLAGKRLDSHEAIIVAARTLGPERVIVTSTPGLRQGHIGNLLVSAHEAHLAEHPVFEHPPKGTGDLLAALFVANLLKGESETAALKHATGSLHDLLVRADGADELPLETNIECLKSPSALAIPIAHWS